jgi:hypothetical protein
MRLESFSRISMRYVSASWHRPYDVADERYEALGFGQGDGVISGEIEGRLVWANPRAVGTMAYGRQTFAA